MSRLPDPYYGNGPGFRSASLTSSNSTRLHELNGANIVSVKTKEQQWVISIQYNTMTQEQFTPLATFLDSLEGSNKSFKVLLPQYRQLGVPNLTVASSHSTLEREIQLTDTSSLSKGMLIQFDNSTKIYRIIDIVGNTITLNCGLYRGITSSANCIFENLEFMCKTLKLPSINTNEDNLIEGFSFTMQEHDQVTYDSTGGIGELYIDVELSSLIELFAI